MSHLFTKFLRIVMEESSLDGVEKAYFVSVDKGITDYFVN